jgi:DNA-binding NarL/FixJ family response regulator
MSKNGLALTRDKARILIVDDHPLVRAGFEALIGGEPDLEVCGEAEGYAEALRLADELEPDAAIVDLSLADGSGLELVKRLHARHPTTRLLVCSMHDESLFAARVLKAGARGYVNKQEATGHVVQAVREVLDGGIYLSPAMTERVRQRTTADAPTSVEGLTDRELEVFSLIGKGVGTAQIATQLHLSVKTVETHREKIKRKLNLASGSELARYAVQWVLEQS